MDSSKRNMRYIYTNKAAFGAVKPTEITVLEIVPQLCTESETVSWLLKQTQKHCLCVSKQSNQKSNYRNTKPCRIKRIHTNMHIKKPTKQKNLIKGCWKYPNVVVLPDLMNSIVHSLQVIPYIQ